MISRLRTKFRTMTGIILRHIFIPTILSYLHVMQRFVARIFKKIVDYFFWKKKNIGFIMPLIKEEHGHITKMRELYHAPPHLYFSSQSPLKIPFFPLLLCIKHSKKIIHPFFTPSFENYKIYLLIRKFQAFEI